MGRAAPERRPMALLAVCLLGAAVGGGAVLLAGGEAGVPDAASPTTAPPSASPADPQHGAALVAEVLDATCGLIAVRGDHADWLADGRYCRLRLAVTNTERATHVWEAAAQEVVDPSGVAHPADLNATQISDQPTTVEIKPGNRLELDAWFDVPEDARIVAARLVAPVDRQQREAEGGEVAVTEVALSPADASAP